jgi:hypothetical protein
VRLEQRAIEEWDEDTPFFNRYSKQTPVPLEEGGKWKM